MERKENKVTEILTTANGRHSVEPRVAKFQPIWECYLRQQQSFWPASKIHFEADKKQWPLLPPEIRFMLDNILGFFSIGDELIMDNLGDNFISEILNPECQTMLKWQTAIEDIHSQVYNKNVTEVYPLTSDKKRVFNLVRESPTLVRKIEFAQKYMNNANATLGERIVAFTAYEGIAFSGSFAAIDWVKTKGYDLEGMYHHNDYISNDEAMHTQGGALKEMYINNKASDNKVKEILDELVDIEIDFWKSIIPFNGLDGTMTIQNITSHVKHCANIVAHMLSRPGIYGGDSVSPFKFLSMRSLGTKYNFFEKEGVNYNMGGENVPISDLSFEEYDDF